MGGGLNASGGGIQDVWALVFNGHTANKFAKAVWVQLTPNGAAPNPRGSSAMAFDPYKLRAIGFGGDAGPAATPQYLGDTFDLIAPAPEVRAVRDDLAAAGPKPLAREGHTALFDKSGDRMIVFGGRAGATYMHDSHVLVSATSPGNENWSPLSPATLPPVRAGHAACMYPYSLFPAMIASGGTNGTNFLSDTWILQENPPGTWSWSKVGGWDLPSSGIAWAAHALDRGRARLYLLGGEGSSGISMDVVYLQLGGAPSMVQVTPYSLSGTFPEPRRYATAISLEGVATLMFGGEGASGPLNDAWLLTSAGNFPSEVWYWVRVPDGAGPPSARYASAMWGRPGHPGFYFLGGRDASGLLADFWGYGIEGDDLGRWWQPGYYEAPALGGLARAAAAYDEKNQRALLFGGSNASGPTNLLTAIHFFQPAGR